MACRMEDAGRDARVMECSANNDSAIVTNSDESVNKSTVRGSGHRGRGSKHNITPHIQNVNNIQDNMSLQPVSDDSECDYIYGVQAITKWNDLPNNPETIVYVADFATITKPLRELLKKKASWYWSDIEQNAVDAMKDALVENATVAYFDPSMDTELTVDASPVGLGAVLAQHKPGQPDS
ncbi:uncharacterized protein [Procambarus clarkii]|uniref:uncharacterized protein n=1 Tax=Procambarus clarkii TaxID=6728 RepID=UPI0037442FA1